MAFKLGTARAALAVGLSEARSQDWPPLSNVRLEIQMAGPVTVAIGAESRPTSTLGPRGMLAPPAPLVCPATVTELPNLT